ncbi:rhodanese-like domain-containing protein [Halorhodospira halophila]|uniref:Rhodanese domain-containing protein n=1 Tax=Halorhodospira halophila (strain DSM 244 / SL1) TaxID=349124 RepID=A1WTY3_HALHL|nr:rhodanese-like domain-containing protein [Halorhodospira halophila]ABM61145.1 hypothetical protein Hhal_0351 [Halorhodospira halophila SL1]MBK1729662.1 rhodanese-like domain-containing protein [Halorhodospira halophila]
MLIDQLRAYWHHAAHRLPTPEGLRRHAVALPLLALIAVPVGPASAGYHSVAPSLEALLAFDGVLIDIRRPYEWQQTGVVEGSVQLTFSNPDSFLEALEPHLEAGTPIALICRTGSRTQQAGRMLARHLDVPVINIEGGIVRLMHLGYDPVPPNGR